MKFTAYIMHVMCLVHVQFIHYTQILFSCIVVPAVSPLTQNWCIVWRKFCKNTAAAAPAPATATIIINIVYDISFSVMFKKDLLSFEIHMINSLSQLWPTRVCLTTKLARRQFTLANGKRQRSAKMYWQLWLMEKGFLPLHRVWPFESFPIVCVCMCVCVSHINQEPAHYHHRHHLFTSSTNEKEMRESLVSVRVYLSVENMCMNLLKPKLIWYFIIM